MEASVIAVMVPQQCTQLAGNYREHESLERETIVFIAAQRAI